MPLLPFTSRPKHRRSSRDLVLGVSVMLPLASAISAQTSDDDLMASINIEEIVVTAQKREQNLQDVPVSISAFSSETIEEAELSTFADISSLAPGITLDQGTETRTTSITIRGVGSSQNNMGIEPSTTMMIDGEVLAQSSALNGDLIDIERVEVLRGPQGTLFGKNTSSGIVHYVTKKPILDEFQGQVKFSADEYNLKKIQATVNVPLTDILALRANAVYSDTDGFMENNKPGEADIGKKRVKGARLQLLFTPTDQLEVLVRAESTESENNCCGSTIIKVADDQAEEPTNPHLVHPAVAPYLEMGWGNLTTYMSDDQISDLKNDAFSVEVNYDLGEHTITYTGHYRDWSLLNNTELAGSTLDISELYFGGTNSFENMQHELRLATNGGGNIDFVAGLFYQQQDAARDGRERFCNQTARLTFWDIDNWVPGDEANDGNPTDFDIDGNLLECRQGTISTNGVYNYDSYYETTVDTKNMAVFGQLDWHLSDALTVFFGARYLKDESELYYKGGRLASQGQHRADRGQPPQATRDPNFQHRADSTDNEFIYRVGGQLNFSDELMVYASYGTGYKGVGWFNTISNAQADIADPDKNPVLPEQSRQIEVGVRSDWWDNRLRVNATAFRTEYKDFQERVREVDEDETYEDGTAVTTPLFVNAGKVISQGLELEFDASLTRAFKLKGNAAYIDAYYDDFGDYFQNCPAGLVGTDECRTLTQTSNNRDVNVLILDGRTLARAPKTQYRIEGRYNFDLMGQDAWWRLAYRWKDNIQYRFNHDPETEHPSYELVDLFVGMRGDMGQGQYNVNLFVKNLFDKTYYSRLVPRASYLGGGYRGIIRKDSQRFFGASVTYKF